MSRHPRPCRANGRLLTRPRDRADVGISRRAAGWSLLLACGLAAAGCAAPIARPGQESPATAGDSASRPETSREREIERAPPANSASVALLSQSRTERADGNLERAAATVERALAIDPNNASLWIELAEIRQEQGDRDQAATLARKALTLAGSDRAIVARAERLFQR